MTDESSRQAAGKPEGNEGLDQGRAWIRELPPEEAKPKGPGKGGKARPRAVYVRELEGGGHLVVEEDGTHRVHAKFSPPEGKGWTALHDETLAKPEEKAQSRKQAKRERKAAAREGDLKTERRKALHERAEANKRRGARLAP